MMGMRPPMPGGDAPPMGGPPMPPQGFPGMRPMPPQPPGSVPGGAPPGPPSGGFPGMRPPPPMGAPMGMPPGPSGPIPHNTLYLSNLTEKEKIEGLKKALYHIFSQFGSIVEIHAKKALKLKGQAWIVFETVQSAIKARQEMSGFNFYGKPMRVEFAKVKSDVVSQKDGSFVHRPLRKVVKSKKRKSKKKKEKVKVKKEVDVEPEDDEKMAGPAPPPDMSTRMDDEVDTKPEPPKPQFDQAARAPTPRTPPQALAPAPPNRILFVENLPEQCNDAMLTMLLQQYDGFKEARLVTGKPGIAFVEFENQVQAGTAKDHLQNFQITPSHHMKITFARQ